MESPKFQKLADFFLYACGYVVDLPHVAKRAFGNQKGLIGQKTCRLAIPLIMKPKIANFLKKIIFDFYRGASRGLRGWWPYFVAGHNYFAVPAAPGGLNAVWV